MTVEVALAVMSGARAERLLLCDEDDQCTGLVTRTQLAAVRESPSYTDRVRLRDVVGADRPFTLTAAMAGTRSVCCETPDQRRTPVAEHGAAGPLLPLFR